MISSETTFSEQILRRTKHLKVLYAEDSASMRHALAKNFEHYFDHIDTAADGLEALEQFKAFHSEFDLFYDIVITDLEMPNMDGQKLTQHLLDLNPYQEIIVISSSNNANRIVDLINLGITKFLTKPVTQESLEKIISDVANSIYLEKLKKDEADDLVEHNRVLKLREKLYLEKLNRNLKTLQEFNNALNESGIVSKTDPDGIITYVNEQFCLLSGYSQDELIGKKHNIINSGEMSSTFFAKLWNTITSGKSYKGVFKNKAKNGSFYYVESLIKPIIDTNDKITEYISIGHDITLMMKSIEDVKQANMTKDNFFRNISHEMRTPLNAILGLISLLKRRSGEDKRLSETIRVIDESANNLHHIIETMLDMQHIQNKTLELQEKEFELSNLLASCLKRCESNSEIYGINFITTFSPDLPLTLFGDPTRIQQILKELLENAFKFNVKNGKVEFSVSYDDEHSQLLVQISDTGIGIKDEDQEKIFEIAQVDDSLTRKHEGSGLGLGIVKALVAKMKGHITLHSKINVGTTFLIELPLKHP